jgi:hypothetical protein
MTKDNITEDFQGAGLISFESEAVLSKLDVKLQILLSTGPSNSDTDPWVSQTPCNLTEAILQSELVKS